MSDVWLCKGTRVPAKALFENLEAGASIDGFLEWCPGVSRDQAEAILPLAELCLAQGLNGSAVAEVQLDQGTPAPLRRASQGHSARPSANGA